MLATEVINLRISPCMNYEYNKVNAEKVDLGDGF
jgi:hypothetical protein